MEKEGQRLSISVQDQYSGQSTTAFLSIFWSKNTDKKEMDEKLLHSIKNQEIKEKYFKKRNVFHLNEERKTLFTLLKEG